VQKQSSISSLEEQQAHSRSVEMTSPGSPKPSGSRMENKPVLHNKSTPMFRENLVVELFEVPDRPSSQIQLAGIEDFQAQAVQRNSQVI
jgi:hypothetical protein